MTGKHRADRRPLTGSAVAAWLLPMFVLVAALVWVDSQVAYATPTTDRITWHTVGTRAVPCKHEDTVPKKGQPACYWDAKQRGNGKGTSFVVWSSGWRMYLR